MRKISDFEINKLEDSDHINQNFIFLKLSYNKLNLLICPFSIKINVTKLFSSMQFFLITFLNKIPIVE